MDCFAAATAAAACRECISARAHQNGYTVKLGCLFSVVSFRENNRDKGPGPVQYSKKFYRTYISRNKLSGEEFYGTIICELSRSHPRFCVLCTKCSFFLN